MSDKRIQRIVDIASRMDEIDNELRELKAERVRMSQRQIDLRGMLPKNLQADLEAALNARKSGVESITIGRSDILAITRSIKNVETILNKIKDSADE